MSGKSAPRRPRSTGCGSASGSCCQTPGFDDELDRYEEIVEHYRRVYLPKLKAEADYYGDPNQAPDAAVRRACLSVRDDALHDHQHRIGHKRMAAAAEFMEPHAGALTSAADFAELHDRVAALGAEVDRVGELAVYDIAQRIGWYRDIEPREIYLHCGTRDGAKALVPQLRGKTMAVDRLPPELHGLTPAQLEDVLCIYKAALTRIAGRRGP